MSLTAVNMSVTYTTVTGDRVEAIKDLDLDISGGEFVTIIGPSGCGKSTLLHCLGGMIKPSNGEVRLQQQRITTPNPRLAAFVFQDYTLLPWKSVLDNAALGLRFAGISKRERRDKAQEMLTMVGLSGFSKSYPSELSGGMQQRVAIARAMLMDPEILLMDEPFGALDEQTRRSLGFEMSRIMTEARRSVVMVTHSLDEAILWADRIIIMSARPGRIIQEIGVSEQRPRRPEFIATPEFAAIRAELFSLLDPSVTTPVEASKVARVVEAS